MIHKISKYLMTLVALLAISTGAWADPQEELLTKITAGANGTPVYSVAGKVTLDKGTASYDGDYRLWYCSGETYLTIAAAEGVTITKVKFTTNYQNSWEDTEAPFQLQLRGWTQYKGQNYTEELSGDGVYVIEVYGYEKDPLDMTWDAATKQGTFTMPVGDVELVPEYYSLAGVKLTSQGTGGTATLLNTAFAPLTETDKIEEEQKFALCLNRADGYDFSLKLSQTATMSEFSAADYESYMAYAKANGQSVDLNTVMSWVTMPDTKDQDLTMAMTFREPKTFTVLYQPTTSADEVWCRMGIPSSSGLYYDVAKMKCDSELDDGTKVWSVKATAAFDPTKVGFFTSKAAAEADGAQTSNATVSNNTTSWTNISGGKYILIGGNAKSVVAAFVADASVMPVYSRETMSFNGSTNTMGVRYQILVCKTDDNGNVTEGTTVKMMSAPTAPEGKTFDKWSVLAGNAPEKIELRMGLGDALTIKENTIFTAVWKPIVLNVTMNLSGGTGVAGSKEVTYNDLLQIGTPKRTGYAFDGWTVNKSVTEGGQLFSKGSLFDTETQITADLGLTAQWHHVHSYTCYRIEDFGTALAAYMKYNDIAHIAVCCCDDIKLTKHDFGANGRCACGMKDPTRDVPVMMDISYGQWSMGNYTEKMKGFPVESMTGKEVTVDAPHNWGDLEFQKWQYSTNNGKTWYDLAAFEIVSFIIPCDMLTRALYVNPVTAPQIDLSTRRYDDHAEVNGKTYTMDNVLFQMNYKLPDGCTFIDGGIRLGDNAGISYYELKERTISMDAECKAIGVGICAVASILNGEITTFDASATEKIYVEHQNSVLDEMSAETLAKYMYESKPVNVEKYEPIYWEAKSPTKGMSGSMATMPPLRFIQKDNGMHYIYGIGWMRYKDATGKVRSIYTDALATTRDVIPTNTVSKSGEQVAGTRRMISTRLMAQHAPSKLFAADPEPETEHDLFDMSLVMAPETQLTVYVDGQWSSDLSRRYGYGDKATISAPVVSGKTFSYWEADGQPVSSSSELALTMNAHTTLRAVYDAKAESAKVGFTSVTRMGNQISMQAHCDGAATAAGIIYSTSLTGDALTIGADGVTQVAAVSAQNLSSATEMPASILDANNSWMLRIAATDETTVYHARAYATVGGITTYGVVRDVKLSDLETGIMSIANIDGFEEGLDAALTELLRSGAAEVLYNVTMAGDALDAEEADKWYVQPTGNVKAGETMTATYTGNRLVKSIEAEGLDLTWNEETKQVTFQMPAYNLQVQVEYEPEFNLTFEAKNALTIAVGKASVTIDAADSTANVIANNGKLSPLYAGQTVTLTAAKGYKFRSVEAKKAGGVPTLADALKNGAEVVIFIDWGQGYNTTYTCTNNNGTFACNATDYLASDLSGSLTLEESNAKLRFDTKCTIEGSMSDMMQTQIVFNIAESSYNYAQKGDSFGSFTISVNGTDITSQLTEVK